MVKSVALLASTLKENFEVKSMLVDDVLSMMAGREQKAALEVLSADWTHALKAMHGLNTTWRMASQLANE
tara:strand:- start:209 stop:418 length:210 start_codon:yes stop_codon:yes gene_type:complete